jgi:hypothetical protein
LFARIPFIIILIHPNVITTLGPATVIQMVQAPAQEIMGQVVMALEMDQVATALEVA